VVDAGEPRGHISAMVGSLGLSKSSAAAASPSAGVVLVDVLADDVSSGANLYLDGDDEHRPSSGRVGLLLLLLENMFRLFLFVEPPPPPPAALTSENDVGVCRLLVPMSLPHEEGRGTTCEASVVSAIVRSGGGRRVICVFGKSVETTSGSANLGVWRCSCCFFGTQASPFVGINEAPGPLERNDGRRNDDPEDVRAVQDGAREQPNELSSRQLMVHSVLPSTRQRRRLNLTEAKKSGAPREISVWS
jgi:hypothetical protein